VTKETAQREWPPRITMGNEMIHGDDSTGNTDYISVKEHTALLEAARRDARAECVSLLEQIREACLCSRFNPIGFDYGENHSNLGRPKPGSRWLTPRDLIAVFHMKMTKAAAQAAPVGEGE
jgi:hypothetical protein